jgi:hypothetical protein
MKFNYIFSVILILTSFVFSACEKEEEINPNEKGELTLEFDNVAGSSDFALNTEYTNASGEKFKVNFLQYYISNIKLKKADGTTYTVPQDESYFLVREHLASSQKITLQNVPAGDYSELTFMIGVDSLRNTKDVSQRTGALDVGNANTGGSMYWSWNSGYIFFRMEGTSPQSTATGNELTYHVGGFGGYATATFNNTRTKTLNFGSDRAKVREGKETELHITADILKVFTGATTIQIANKAVFHSPTAGVEVANNYVNMFVFDHVHN